MGSHEEFLKLFLWHQDGVRAFLGSVVRDRAAAEDLFQEVSLALWESFPTYDATRPFGAWAPPIDDPNRFQPDWSGTYHLAFTGQAVIGSSDASQFRIENQRFDPATNKTTADVLVPRS